MWEHWGGGAGTESSPGGLEKEKGPSWAPQHLLGTCCVPRAQEKGSLTPAQALRSRPSSQAPGEAPFRLAFLSTPPHQPPSTCPGASLCPVLASSLRRVEPPIRPWETSLQSPTANITTAKANFTDFHSKASPLSQNPSAWEISSLEAGIKVFKIQHKTLS